MTLKTLLRAGSITALGAVLALGAVPAMAQAPDTDTDVQHNAEQSARPVIAQARQQARQEARQQRQEARAAAPQDARQPRAERQWQAPQQQQQQRQREQRSRGDWNPGERRSDTGAERSGRDWNRRDNSNNDWGQARAAQAQAQAQAQVQAQAQAQATARTRSQRWEGRRQGGTSGTSNTGVYSGANTGNWERNRTYGDRTRNTTYRHGYRDAVRGDRPGDGHHAAGTRRDGRSVSDSYRHGYRDASRGYRQGDGHHQWDRRWRGDNRYNWSGYRSSNRDIYRLGRYYAPYNDYRYSRVSIGFRLGSLFFGSRYWINDPWQYRLPAAYGPYRWVRYYDDALLVDTYSGEVVDVIHDFFW